MIDKYEDLPEYLKFFLVTLMGDEAGHNYATRKVPAMNHKSIIELMNSEHGREIVHDVLNRLAGKVGESFNIKYDKKSKDFVVRERDKIIYPEN